MCSGIKNARQLVEEVRAGRADYDFVEVSRVNPDILHSVLALSLRVLIMYNSA